jgi:hypothetical protein
MDNSFNIEMDQVGSDICTILEYIRRSMSLLQVIVFFKKFRFSIGLAEKYERIVFFLLAN